MENLFRLKDLTVEEINDILDLANQCKEGKYDNYLQNKIVANCFFEPSTRTQYSFNTAQLKLGMKVISFNSENSSLKKGETFYDTLKTFESFQIDGLVIRDRKDHYYEELTNINIPILNAGDGASDHPTQSLLDLLTIRNEFGHFAGLKIAIVGDIKYSRVAHSNIEVMERLGMECYVSGPEEYREEGYKFIDFDEAIEKMDIIMLLRVQHERHEEKMKISTEEYHQRYGLTMERVNRMPAHAIIMHPAPFNRMVEIADDVVECSKSRIFKQVENGVLVRMAAILKTIGGL
ncbi:MAG: aspartate carbamoyltransferase catalytic subunit [Erysipelotrichaceae bacterium]|nr:aspartate carbamoyltransferase catalytic subunit [Erysipelotrichaceae bacterium]MDY5252658.1 aspartate carbamoyltransferase catalytic subunit [Erysipelotrichaceae bacterium]